jgi:DNA-binding beta-propeller fold protein YncE
MMVRRRVVNRPHAGRSIARARAFTVVACILAAVAVAAPNVARRAVSKESPTYTILQRFVPGGEGGWDYLTIDGKSRRLYVSRSTRVQVLDADTGTLVGEIADTPGVHGIALVPERHRAYTSNGRDSTLTIFDTRSLATLGRIRVPGKNPDAITYDPATRRIFAFNAGSATATVVDVAADTIVRTIDLGGAPEEAVADGEGRMYVNLEDSSVTIALDTRALAVVSRWPVAPGEGPSGLALDQKHRRLFVNCGNKRMVILDADSGRVITSLPIGEREDGAAFDPERGLAFSPNGEGTLTVVREVNPQTFVVVETVQTQRGGRTIALDPKTHRVYVPAARYGTPPEPTAEHPHPRPPILPGSFTVLVIGPTPQH